MNAETRTLLKVRLTMPQPPRNFLDADGRKRESRRKFIEENALEVVEFGYLELK